MAYINKSYLSTQFSNFATKINEIFAKKIDITENITDLDINLNILTYTRADGTIGTIDLSSVSKLVWNGETTIIWNE